ncbi:MAG: 3-methyladenine DNA glycosylase [Gemmatimonas sp.]
MKDSSLPPSAAREPTILSTAEWQTRARVHRERVEPWTKPFRERRSRLQSHPVYDFLFTYYSYSGGRLEKWHPAPNERLVDSPEARDRFRAPTYQGADGLILRDAYAISDATRSMLTDVRDVMRATRERAPNFGCFGMHEWAMVYGAHEVRHAEIAPLRLPQAEIDALVETRPVACSHFDAFRFFARAAQPMNRLPLAWATRYDAEQPGCIHANMDLYRWAYTSMPWIGSDLLWDCFALATELRVLDMQAGPYDLAAMGFPPVKIETPEGREQYQRRQRELSGRAAVLRDRLIDALDEILPVST